MPLVHNHCGGFISGLGKCDKCNKRWNPIVFWLNPNVQKQVKFKRASSDDIAKKIADRQAKGSYSKWADNIPGVGAIASALPHWPRKVRIAVVLGLVAVIVLLVVFLS
jgi:ribosomal protein L32E